MLHVLDFLHIFCIYYFVNLMNAGMGYIQTSTSNEAQNAGNDNF